MQFCKQGIFCLIAVLVWTPAVDGQIAAVASSSCEATLSGSEFPELVPNFLAWEALLDELQRDGANHVVINKTKLGESGYGLVAERTATLRAQIVTLRTRHASQAAHVRDAEIADAIADARDDLVRALPTQAYSPLKAAINAAKRRQFALPAPGRIVRLDSTGSGCQVTALGREYPHLIREQFYWRLYFEGIAGAAEKFRFGQNDYAKEHIAAVRAAQPIPMPWQYITQLLEVATQTVAGIRRLPNTEAADAMTDAIVEEARNQLIRTLPRPVWLAVKAHANRSRAGSRISFPPSK